MSARAEQILYTVRNMGAESLRDMEQLTWFTDVEAFALNRASMAGPRWALTNRGLPVAVGGINLTRPRVATAWFIATDELREVARDALVVARLLARRVLAAPEVQRLEATVREDWPAAVRFAAACGLGCEGRHERVCFDGGAVRTYAMTKGEAHA